MKRGKKYVEAAKAVDRATLYDTAEAISLVKKAAVAKFDETIEAHIRTGLFCRTEPVKRFVFLYLQEMQKLRKQKLQAQNS